MRPDAEQRIRDFYYKAVADYEFASARFGATKPYEVILFPWRPFLRYLRMREAGMIELARFEAGVKAFGAVRWMQIIDMPQAQVRPHVIKGGKC